MKIVAVGLGLIGGSMCKAIKSTPIIWWAVLI